MQTQNILGAIAVADIERAIAWYSKLFGRKVDDRPMKEAAEWRLTQGGGVQLVLDPTRAGRSMLTVGLGDLDEAIEETRTRGIELKRLDVTTGPYSLAQVADPDGNVLTFAQPKK